MFRNKVYFTLNGELIEVAGANAFAPLSDTLRYNLRRTGTKVVCAEGDCGACTIMLQNVSSPKGFYAINACIFPTFSADGCHLVTVEGLATRDAELHEIQNSMVRNFGGQCGFCTPGFVMAIANLYEQKKSPSEKCIKNYLTGNLCRCTGYQPIIEAALDVDANKIKSLGKIYPLLAETELLKSRMLEPLLIEHEEKEIYAPLSLKEVVQYKAKNPTAKIFSGATDLGVQINKGKSPGVKRVSLHLIAGMDSVAISSNQQLHVGARVTLAQLQKDLEKSDADFSEFLNIFASPQIKNVATLVGNLANGSPIADTIPYLMAVDAEVHLLGVGGERIVPLKNFYRAYKSFDMSGDEFITGVSWPRNQAQAKIGLYKVSQRRDLDISCVNACFKLILAEQKIISARIVYGGVGPTVLRLYKLEDFLVGKALTQKTVSETQELIAKSIAPLADARGTAGFRESMAKQLFAKYVEEKLTQKKCKYEKST